MQAPLYHPVKADLPRISAIYAEAFSDSPSHTWALPDPVLFKRHAPRCFKVQASLALRAGVMMCTSERLEGTLQYGRPGTRVSNWAIIQSGMLGVVLTSWGGPFAERWLRLTRFGDSVRERIVPEPHHYLWTIAVQPRHQRQGHGTRLMQAFLNEVDAARGTCYLETYKEHNVPYYSRFGFELAEAIPVPGTPLVLHAMTRAPRDE